jgi:hypothetical protein
MPLIFILFQLLKALIGRFQVILFIYLKCILLILTQKHVLNILNIFNHKALMTRCLRTHPFANIPFLCGKKKVKSQHLAKVSRLLCRSFFLEIFKIQRLLWIFYLNFGYSECVFHQCLFKVVTNIIFLCNCELFYVPFRFL